MNNDFITLRRNSFYINFCRRARATSKYSNHCLFIEINDLRCVSCSVATFKKLTVQIFPLVVCLNNSSLLRRVGSSIGIAPERRRSGRVKNIEIKVAGSILRLLFQYEISGCTSKNNNKNDDNYIYKTSLFHMIKKFSSSKMRSRQFVFAPKLNTN